LYYSQHRLSSAETSGILNCAERTLHIIPKVSLTGFQAGNYHSLWFHCMDYVTACGQPPPQHLLHLRLGHQMGHRSPQRPSSCPARLASWQMTSGGLLPACPPTWTLSARPLLPRAGPNRPQVCSILQCLSSLSLLMILACAQLLRLYRAHTCLPKWQA